MTDPRAYEVAGDNLGLDPAEKTAIAIAVNIVLSFALAWLCALLAYITALPFFLLSYPDAFHVAWYGGGIDTNELNQYRQTRDLIFFFGFATGVLITQVSLILYHLRQDKESVVPENNLGECQDHTCVATPPRVD